jgi:cell division septation protein DedD
VQVAALSDPTAMTRVEGIIRRMGLTPYRVDGPNGLTKLQAGPFATREAANARLDELTKAIGGRPYVTRAP